LYVGDVYNYVNYGVMQRGHDEPLKELAEEEKQANFQHLEDILKLPTEEGKSPYAWDIIVDIGFGEEICNSNLIIGRDGKSQIQ